MKVIGILFGPAPAGRPGQQLGPSLEAAQDDYTIGCVPSVIP
jgi:hypothetical protein